MVAGILGQGLSTPQVSCACFPRRQQQTVVDIDGVTRIYLAITVLFEEFAAVPPCWKLHYPAGLAILGGAHMDSLAIGRHQSPLGMVRSYHRTAFRPELQVEVSMATVVMVSAPAQHFHSSARVGMMWDNEGKVGDKETFRASQTLKV
jgi:hypothetical protein